MKSAFLNDRMSQVNFVPKLTDQSKIAKIF